MILVMQRTGTESAGCSPIDEPAYWGSQTIKGEAQDSAIAITWFDK